MTKSMTPAEQELLDIYEKNSKDGLAENVHRICVKHGWAYNQAKAYNKRLEAKGLLTQSRCGTGRACPVTLILERNLK